MSKYDELYDFRLASKEDVDTIMLFLKTEWGENHILANDKEFFLWQYGNEQYGDKNTINFVMMTDKSGNIMGLNGFIPYALNPEERYVSSAIIKVSSKVSLPMSGVELIKRFKELVPAKAYYSSGTNPKTILPIGKTIFKYKTGKMQQYYMLNPNIKEFKIAKVSSRINYMELKKEYELVHVESFDELKRLFDLSRKYKRQGYKSPEYIRKRYFEHLVYSYDIYGLAKEYQKNFEGILIGREIEVDNQKIFRIVDYLGDIENLKNIGETLRKIIIKNQYEYVDLVVGEIEEELLKESGFTLRNDNTIIPMYFEPFIRENIDIYYQKSDENIVIFKADGDQDRPNHR